MAIVLLHSAKGSEWEDHMYVKKVDGKYYYQDGYENGRTISSLKNKSNSNSSGGASNRQIVGDGSELDNMAISVIRGDYGNGLDRKQALGDRYQEIQARVNELLGVTTKIVSKVADTRVNSQNVSEQAIQTVEKTIRKLSLSDKKK